MIKIFETQDAVAEAIALEMQRQLEVKEHPVFCLASGSTPAKSYQKFVEKCAKYKEIKKLKFVSLDEWVDVEHTRVGSCYQMLKQDLFQHLSLNREQITFFETLNSDLRKECERIDDFIKNNPITFSLMGVGMNGHIGLNEPEALIKNYSSVVHLSDTTKKVAQKYFTEFLDLERGITIGLQQVIDSERVIVVITGSHKREIVKEIVENAHADLPTQKLLGFEHIDYFIDKEAAKLIKDEHKELME